MTTLVNFHTAIDTLRARHNQAVSELAKMPVPPSPTLYDNHGEIAWLLEAHVAYMRAAWAKMKPCFELCAEIARDYAGANVESIDMMDACLDGDIIPGFERAVEEQIEADVGRRAGR